MYKLKLCLRYLGTRYLAFVCVVSVLLGVATLIVVNSVMSGFSNKLKDRLRGALSDVVVATERPDGFALTTPELEQRIRDCPSGAKVKAISPTIETFALLQYTLYDRRTNEPIPITKQVRLIGVDPAKHSQVGGFGSYLQNSKTDPAACFDLSKDARHRFEMNRLHEAREAAWEKAVQKARGPVVAGPPVENPLGFLPKPPVPVGDSPLPPVAVNDAVEVRLPGIVLGYSIASARLPDPNTGEMVDQHYLKPGDDVFIATVGSSGLRPVAARFVVTDYFKSDMSEYDSNFVYVPLADLQRIRGMDDRVNSVQIRLTDDVRGNSKLVGQTVVKDVQALQPQPESYVQSWEQLQGPLLDAINIERALLNVLLFLIVGVAGFGVLAIFSMIVSEKYRDIGILKSLGASSSGVMAIFLGYGLLLGVVGCVLGTTAGLLITDNINAIEKGLTVLTGQEVFDRKVYYFDKIPTNVEPPTVLLVNLGAIAVAVLSSIVPAVRAARLQPVRALRFE